MADGGGDEDDAPYKRISLVSSELIVDSENKRANVTAIESWDSSIYVGTGSGEILHFFSTGIESDPYIIASKQRTHARKRRPVSQIILLPSVSRALVLSQSTTSVFTLPEFAPCSNVGSMRDVNWLSRDVDDKEMMKQRNDQEFAEITVFSKSVIRFVKVFNDSLKLIRNVDYPGVLVGVRRSSYALVANNENYDLLDLENVRKIPLFPIGSVGGEDVDVSEGVEEVKNVEQQAHSEEGTVQDTKSSQQQPTEEIQSTQPEQLIDIGEAEYQPEATHAVVPTIVSQGDVSIEQPHSSQEHPDQPLIQIDVESTEVPVPDSFPGVTSPTTLTTTSTASVKSSQSIDDNSSIDLKPTLSPQSTSSSILGGQSMPSSSTTTHKPIQPDTKGKSKKKAGTQQNTHLHPHSRSSSHMPKPIILPVSKEEFLVTSGTTISDKSMGLVVNIDGEISRGTIAWPKYPSSVAIDYPFVVAVIDNQIHLHSLHDQRLVQVIDFPSKPLIVNVSSDYSTPYTPSVEKISLSPLFLENEDDINSNQVKDKISSERSAVANISICSSSIFIYTVELGIECLVPTPRFINLEKLVLIHGKIDDVYDEVERMDFSTELSIIQLQYLNLLIGLYYLKQNNFENVIKSWLTYSIDPRLIIFIFDKVNVKGDVWIFNGLIKLIKELQEKFTSSSVSSLFLSSSFETTSSFLQTFYKEWFKKREMASLESSNKENIFKSLELSYLQLLLKLEEKGKVSKSDIYFTIDEEIISSTEECIKLLSSNNHLIYLSHLYKKLNMPSELLNCWKTMLIGISPDFPNGEEVMADYLINQCENEQLVWDYGAWLIQTYPKIGIKVFTSPDLKVIIDESQVVDVIKSMNNDEAWRQYLKYLVYEKNRTLFAADLATVMIDDIIERIRNNEEIKQQINEDYENYRKLSVPKVNFIKYLQRTRLIVPIKDNTKKVKRGLSFKTTSISTSTSASTPTPSPFDIVLSLRIELMKLLNSTDNFDPTTLMRISQDEPDSLLLEQCVVFGRLGIHEQCLDILCHRLTDYKTAIDYCIYGKILLSETATPIPLDLEIQKDLFRQLLLRFLKIPDPASKITCTRILLEQWGNRLDISLVLSLLPTSWPIEIISGYLCQFFKKTLAEQHQASISRSLARSENLFISKQLEELISITASTSESDI